MNEFPQIIQNKRLEDLKNTELTNHNKNSKLEMEKTTINRLKQN